MPERLDATLTALLTGRSLCYACIGARTALTAEGARAVAERLAETIVLRRARQERCHGCGDITETVGIDYAATRCVPNVVAA